jgi:hypothetical protein
LFLEHIPARSHFFLIVFCFGGLFLEHIPARSHFRTFLLGQNISLTHAPLFKTRFVYLCSSSLHSILLSHDIISVCVVCVFLWLRLVSLCLWLCSVEVCNPTFPFNLSLQVFFLFWSSHLWFSIVFFQSCRRSVAWPPGISVLDVQVLETSNVLAYINFCCVVLEILCLFSELCFVFALDCAHETSLMCLSLALLAWTRCLDK